MLRLYAALFKPPGVVAFVAAGFVSRLTTAIVSFGLLLALSAHGGSYAVASVSVAVLTLASGLALPAFGRLYDRRGQQWVLVRIAPVFGALMITLMAAIASGAPSWLIIAASAAAGLSMPVTGPLVRARWTAIFHGQPLLRTAYGFESATIEIVYIAGPILAAALATGVGRMAPLVAVVVCGVGGSLALAMQRGTQPEPAASEPEPGHRTGGVWRLAELRVLYACRFFVGVVFGSVPVATVVFATAHNGRSESGLLVGLWGLTSMVAGLGYGGLKERAALYPRLLVTLVLFALGGLPLLAARGMLSAAAVLLISGITMAPVTVSAMEVLQRAVPASILNETIFWDGTVLAFGMAAGTAAAGACAQHLPSSLTFGVSAAGGVLALAVVAIWGGKIQRACTTQAPEAKFA
jgi:MFS family permease